VTTVEGYMNSPERLNFDRTVFRQTPGQKRTLHWQSAQPVPIQKEIQLLMSGNLVRKGEFGPLYGSRVLEVELECCEVGLTFHQAISIRKQIMMGKLLQGCWKLKEPRIMKSIIDKFEHQQKPLLEIAEQYDLPPVSIFREILAPRVLSVNSQPGYVKRKPPARRIVQSIINESSQDNMKSFLSEWEIKELQTAKHHDVVGYKSNCTSAEDWEQQIYNFLDEQGIRYVTEDSLKLQGCETKTIGTPDCLLVDDLMINGRPIRWIEFKS